MSKSYTAKILTYIRFPWQMWL